MKTSDTLFQNSFRYIFTCFLLFLVVYRGVIAFSYTPELVNGESNNIWNAINVSQGKPIYTNPEALPLEIFQYTPLSQFPIVCVAFVFDSSEMNYVHNITVIGRLFTLLLNLLTALLLYFACVQLYPTNRWLVALSCLLGLASLTHLSFAIRPDAMASFLMMLSFFCFTTFTVSSRTIYLILCSLVLALAFMAKQDAIVIIAPLSLVLLLQGKWKQLVLFDLAFITFLTGIILLGHWFLGTYFVKSIFIGLNNPVSYHQFISVLQRLVELYPVHVFAGNFAIVLGLWGFKNQSKLLPLTLVTLFFECFAFLTTSKVGSGVSYYTPFILFSSVLILISLYSVWQHKAPSLPLKYGILLVVLTVSGIFIFRQAYHYTAPFLKYEISKAGYEHRWTEIEKVRKEIHLKQQDRILVLEPLTRIMLATNTIMPNLEYYMVSPFDYSDFIGNEEKGIDYLIFQSSSASTMEDCMKFFNINPTTYVLIETKSEYTILAKK